MNIAAKRSEQPKLIHLYNEDEFVKDIIDKIGKYVISIKEDYTRDCRNRRKWDLARLRNRIDYMHTRGELHDEREENSYTLQAKANAVNDNSRRNYDNDQYNDQRDIKREGQPREDGRDIIIRERERRLHERARKTKRERDTDHDKDKDNRWDKKDKEKDWRADPRQEQKKTKYDKPYERRWCSICNDNGEEDWRCKTHNAVDCSRKSTRTSHQGHAHKNDTEEDKNQRYTPDDIQRAKAIIAYEMQCHGLTTCNRISTSTSRRRLPKETEQGMEESSDDDDDDEAATRQLKNYIGFDYEQRRPY